MAKSSPLRTTLRTAAHMVAGRAFPPAAAIKTRSAHAATAVVPAVLMRAFGGLSDLLTRSAAFVRGRVDQRLPRRTSSFYFRVLVLLPLISVALWGLTLYGRTFWSESGTLAERVPILSPTRRRQPSLLRLLGLALAFPKRPHPKKKPINLARQRNPRRMRRRTLPRSNPPPKQCRRTRRQSGSAKFSETKVPLTGD